MTQVRCNQKFSSLHDLGPVYFLKLDISHPQGGAGPNFKESGLAW